MSVIGKTKLHTVEVSVQPIHRPHHLQVASSCRGDDQASTVRKEFSHQKRGFDRTDDNGRWSDTWMTTSEGRSRSGGALRAFWNVLQFFAPVLHNGVHLPPTSS
jgi:hypothetical protein